MSDTKISDAVPALWGVRIGDSDTWGYVEVESDADFIGKKSGLSYEKRPFYLRPQPAELAEQNGDGREPFEAWATSKGLNVVRSTEDIARYAHTDTFYAWQGYQAALAATGKQQVGAKCLTCNDRGWVGGPTFSDPAEGGMQCPDCNALDAHMERYEQQVGEVQGRPDIAAVMDRCIRELRSFIDVAHDYDLDEMAVQALETAIESMELRKQPAQGIDLGSIPDGWSLRTLETCYQLSDGNQVVANLVGPDAERNAQILATLIDQRDAAPGVGS